MVPTDKSSRLFYDVFCDHGQLGIEVIKNSLVDKVIFVDKVFHIIEKLESNLKKLKIDSSAYELISDSAENIAYRENSCVALCGVGVDIIKKVISKVKKPMNFIISTHSRPLELRSFLSENHFSLQSEKLVFENGKFYEILKVINTENCGVKIIGDFDAILAKKYYENLHQNYILKNKFNKNTIYSTILKELESFLYSEH